MNWDAIGAVGELLGALVVVVTLGYLAIQIRQNTAQQKREETVSIQRGQNEILSQLSDPIMMRSYAMTADEGRAANPEDRSRAIIWLVQYLNHFQIVYDLYQLGSLEEDRYKFWESIAVAFVASKGLREWWDEDNGKLAFEPKIRSLIDSKLNDPNNAPMEANETWDFLNAKSWRA